MSDQAQLFSSASVELKERRSQMAEEITILFVFSWASFFPWFFLQQEHPCSFLLFKFLRVYETYLIRKEFVSGPRISPQSPLRTHPFPHLQLKYFSTLALHSRFTSTSLDGVFQLPIQNRSANHYYTIKKSSFRQSNPIIVWQIIFDFIILHKLWCFNIVE